MAGSTASSLTPPEGAPLPPRPRPLANSLTASARRITTFKTTRVGTTADGWQGDAWDMYDLVGEERFLAATLAGQLSKGRLFVGRINPEDKTADPEPVDDDALQSILDAVGDSQSGREQLVNRLGINLFVAGEGWLVGIPQSMLPSSMRPPTTLTLVPTEPEDTDPGGDVPDGTLSPDDLEWRALSVDEVRRTGTDRITLSLGQDQDIECLPSEVWLVRVWRPHPRKSWEADSPTRSSLPVLREIVGLTMHISAQVDSRLAGAGLLIVPQSATRALRVAAGLPEESEDDPFTDALIEAMTTPINNRSSAAAVVPLTITVPDEAAAMFKHITFATPLDGVASQLRDEAIRRLALGQDAPPELLLGTSGMNHWGAWLVREDVVTTHLEPPMAIICDALTTQYLWPVLLDQRMPEDTVHEHVIWYDYSDLIVRPNRSQDAVVLHERGAISDEALRTAAGFDESDAPAGAEEAADVPIEVSMALDLISKAPALVANPGLPSIVAQIREVLANPGEVSMQPLTQGTGKQPGEESETPPQLQPGGSPPDAEPSLPNTDQSPAQPPTPPVPPGLAAGGRLWPAAAIIDAFENEGPDGKTFVHGYIGEDV